MMAAKAAGLDSLPVAYVDVDDATALKILLADNRTNDLATYDNKELAELLADVSNTIGLDGTGFDEAFLDGLIGELSTPNFAPGTEDEQGQLDQKKPVTCPECGNEFAT
jgi:ParB-like chromosome segregation protein Spo0J